jgi:putative addiction module CopG family antidote
MTIHLPEGLQRFVQAKVRSGRFTSSDEAITEAVRLLQQLEEASTLEGIRQGMEDMKAGRGRPAEEVFADIRREFNLPSDA